MVAAIACARVWRATRVAARQMARDDLDQPAQLVGEGRTGRRGRGARSRRPDSA
ncbi:MAG: hypothetical protein WDO24_10880 [Pseudomonadota bacterium]